MRMLRVCVCAYVCVSVQKPWQVNSGCHHSSLLCVGKDRLATPVLFPCRPSLLPFQWRDIKGRVITLDVSCQFSLNLFISFRVSLEGYTHGKFRLLSSHRRRNWDCWQAWQYSFIELCITVTREGVTTICQTLTTAILSLPAASLSVGCLFSVDASPLIRFLLVFKH